MPIQRVVNRADIPSNWEAVNPILLPGEVCVELITGMLKVGNGARWNDTPYYTGDLASTQFVKLIPDAALGDTTQIDEGNIRISGIISGNVDGNRW